ncbi:hypothetical protein HYX17_05370 [Candidatus Woesearchaeota archaeon]|nr:hypothetical protein [Candidatus Woesearchaeota archaeon]
MSLELGVELEKQGFVFVTNINAKGVNIGSGRKMSVEKYVSLLEKVFPEVVTIGFFGPIYDTGPKKYQIVLRFM